MKRTRAGYRASLSGSPEGEQGFWPSFADMMSSFALILFFLMLIAYLQNLITGNDLTKVRQDLLSTEASLTQTLAQLTQAKLDLDDVNGQIGVLSTELGEAQSQVATQREQMTLQQATIEEQLAAIAEQQAKIAEQAASITAQQATISQQAAYIATTDVELTAMRSQMENIAGIRMEILRRMQASIGESLGDASKVSIGDNGNLVLSDGLLFETGKYSINSEGESMLNSLAAALGTFLDDQENRQYVDSIVISGHTDSVGSDEYNQTLSTNRANAVVDYLTGRRQLRNYKQYFCASGYGESRPIADNSTEQGKAQNRRIEISIILKDETVMAILDQYLATEVPDASGVVINAGTAAP